MSKNLVMGMIFGYSVEKIKPFVLSLRQHYQGDVVFMTASVTEEQQRFFDDYGIYTFIPDAPLARETCQTERFRVYRECLTEYFDDVENILVSDTRDVVFQSDPFAEYPKHDLEFFAEPELFRNCQHNRPWIYTFYGMERLVQMEPEYVICSGTTMGTRSAMMHYFTAMVDEFDHLRNTNKMITYEDQACHNHLIYNNTFQNYAINHNGIGPISTMHHSKNLNFNRAGYLLNNDGKVIPVVHQYDRCGPMSVTFVKNALGVHGKSGIKIAAEYAAAHFPEHDLG
jgi:hypothetical protein